MDYVNDFIFSGEYVLLAEDGTVSDDEGHPVIQLVDGDFWVNNHAHILQGKNGYSNYLLYVALRECNISQAITGAVQLKVNQANLLNIEIPMIDADGISLLNSMYADIFKRILFIRKENNKLNELKQLYLKKFFG